MNAGLPGHAEVPFRDGSADKLVMVLIPFLMVGLASIALGVWSMRVSTDNRDSWQEAHDRVMRPLAPVWILLGVALIAGGVISAIR